MASKTKWTGTAFSVSCDTDSHTTSLLQIRETNLVFGSMNCGSPAVCNWNYQCAQMSTTWHS